MYGETIRQNTKLYLDFENRKNRIAYCVMKLITGTKPSADEYIRIPDVVAICKVDNLQLVRILFSNSPLNGHISHQNITLWVYNRQFDFCQKPPAVCFTIPLRDGCAAYQ